VDAFAFIIHPINPKRDVSRKFPFLGRILNERQINFFSTFFPPVYISEITGITSTATGKTIHGWFIACPLTPVRMVELPEKIVYRKIIEAGRLAEKLGAKLLGLGAFTSVIGDGGKTVAEALDIPVTTGGSYTVATAVSALEQAGEMMGIMLDNTPLTILGAAGSIGKTCAELLAPRVPEMHLVGRDLASIQAVRDNLADRFPNTKFYGGQDARIVSKTRLVLTATSAVGAVIGPEDLLPGSVVCDVARPRDVSARVAAERDDVLVIDGGMVDVPGPVDFHFDFGFPPGKAYACMAETMALTLDGNFTSFSLGKDLTRSKVEEIKRITDRHGFQLSGFRSFEKPVSPDQINAVRNRALPDGLSATIKSES
jgi:predicted amino acid dehydrogenase